MDRSGGVTASVREFLGSRFLTPLLGIKILMDLYRVNRELFLKLAFTEKLNSEDTGMNELAELAIILRKVGSGFQVRGKGSEGFVLFYGGPQEDDLISATVRFEGVDIKCVQRFLNELYTTGLLAKAQSVKQDLEAIRTAASV